MFFIIRFPNLGIDCGVLKFEVWTKVSHGRTCCLCLLIHSFGSGISLGSCKKLEEKYCMTISTR